VEVRLPLAPVLGRWEQRPDLDEEGEPLVVWEIGEPAHGREERDQPVAVERLRIRKTRLPKRLEG